MRLTMICLVAGILLAAPAQSAPTACMLRVLKDTPGVSAAHAGLNHRGGATYDYVQYRVTGTGGHVLTVRFVAKRYVGAADTFEAVLPGLFTPGTPGPPDWGTRVITRAWRTRCGVAASVLYE